MEYVLRNFPGCFTKPNMAGSEDTANEMVDDVWTDSDEEFVDRVSTADLKRIHTKQGYLDGLSNAKESSLQQGFDDGYPKGGQIGISVGHILATVLANDEKLYLQCKKELVISKVLERGYFDQNLEIQHHQVLDKWQKICKEFHS